MLIVAVDPGGTTGFCCVDTELRTVEARQLPTHQAVVEQLYTLWQRNRNERSFLIVIEDFIGSGKRDVNIVNTVKLLGYVQLWAVFNKIECVTQVPQYRLPFVSIAEKKYPTHAERHRKDAYAHALAYLCLNRVVENNNNAFEVDKLLNARAYEERGG